MKILVAEDQLGPGLVRILKRTYPDANISLTTDGNEGYMVFTQFEPDLVITDWNMPPGMNGGQLAAMIRQRSPDQKIILWSGSPCPEDYSKYFNQILSKDIDSCLWKDVIEGIMHGDQEDSSVQND